LAAAIGVQSEKNRQRDFESGNPGRFVVVGIIAVLVFVCVIYLVVQLVIKSTRA
jgi:putative flippase GtrA